jgi:hypothetical protein
LGDDLPGTVLVPGAPAVPLAPDMPLVAAELAPVWALTANVASNVQVTATQAMAMKAIACRWVDLCLISCSPVPRVALVM